MSQDKHTITGVVWTVCRGAGETAKTNNYKLAIEQDQCLLLSFSNPYNLRLRNAVEVAW